MLRQLLKTIWERASQTDFSDIALFNLLRSDGGIDAEKLTASIISDLIDEIGQQNRWLVVNAVSSLLTEYCILGVKMSGSQLAASVFVVCVLADAARAGLECDWSNEHAKVLTIANIILSCDRTELFTLEIMRYVYGKEGRSPELYNGAWLVESELSKGRD